MTASESWEGVASTSNHGLGVRSESEAPEGERLRLARFRERVTCSSRSSLVHMEAFDGERRLGVGGAASVAL